MQQQQSNQPIIYIVQHMEPFLFTWCKHQYLQMLQYLQKYSSFQGANLYFTNARIFLQFKGKQQEENKHNVQQLIQAYKKYQNNGGFIFESLGQNLKNNNGKLKIPQEPFVQHSTKFYIYQPFQICLLDMRAKEVLSPNDKSFLRVFIFGGILGDHPPRDRTKALREYCPTLRHMGQMQLSTDTAVLTTKLIIHNNISFDNIPFVKQPQIIGPNKQNQKTVIQMQGFSYINSNFDWKQGKINETMVENKNKQKNGDQIIINPFIRKLLLQEQLDVSLFM